MTADGTKRPLKLVTIDSGEKTAQTIHAHLADKGVRLVGEAANLKAGLRLVRGHLPDLVLVEVPAGDAAFDEVLDAVRRIRTEQPECGIILNAAAVSPDLILRSMRAGAHEFVGRPVDAAELEKAIDHVRKTLDRSIAGKRRRGTMISVFSSKGGAGGSMVATNLAVALAQNAGTRVALVDLSFQMGDLGLMLDLRPRYSLADVVGNALEEGELKSVLAEHVSGVFLLAVAGSPDDGQKVERQHLVDAFGLLNTMFDFIVVDVERYIDERTLEVLDLSDHILVISTLNLPAVRNAKRCLDLFRSLEIEAGKFELVVNRHDNKNSGLRKRDMEGTVGLPVSWLIPNDYQVANHSVDAGVPFVSSTPRSKIAKSFQEYAALQIAAAASHAESAPAPGLVE